MQPQTYRSLGATEHAVWLRDRATPLHFALIAQISGTIHPDSLQKALERLQQRHPLLRANIEVDRQGTPYFVEHPAPIPCWVIPRQGDPHWQKQVVQELARPFVWSAAPLMRVVLLHASHQSDLIVVCHHAIADGIAVVNLLQELLVLLSQPDAELPARPVPPSLETLQGDRRPAAVTQILLARVLLGLKQSMQRLKQSTNPALTEPPPLQVEAGDLSPELTTALMHRCRMEGTTVHAAMSAALLFAIALNQRATPNQLANKQLIQTLKCFSPANLRPYLQSASPLDCGIYVAPVQTLHNLAADSLFWEIARSLKAALMAKLRASHLLQLAQQHEVLVGAKPTPEMIRQIFVERCASDVMVTNLGRLEIPQQFGGLRLRAIYGPVVLSAFKQERVVGIATLGDQLRFTFTHQPSMNSTSSMHLAEQAIQLVKMAIAQPNLTLSAASELPSACVSTAAL